MKYLLFIVLLVAVVIAAGCVGGNQNSAVTPTPQIVYVTVLVTPTQTAYSTSTSQSVYITVTPDQKAQETVFKGGEQSTANIQMIGNVYGLSTDRSTITSVTFVIGLATGASAIDLTKMKIVFSTPTTAPIILTQGTTPSATVFTTKIGATAVTSMNPNDQVEIAFSTAAVPANTRMTIELRPSVGAALPFTKTAPATISATNVLY